MFSKLSHWLLGVGMVGLLAACNGWPAAGGASPLPTQGLQALRRPTQTATPTHRPTRTDTPTWTSTPPTPSATFTSTPVTPTDTPTQTPVFTLCSPVATLALDEVWRYVSDGYHPPPMGSDERHQGIDITYFRLRNQAQTIEGVTAQSALPGRVAAAIPASFPYGNVVIVETRRSLLPADLAERLGVPEDQSLYLLYAHLQDGLLVTLGAPVTGCQGVGHIGKSGNTDSPHLHLEVRTGPPGFSFESLSSLLEGLTGQERENYHLWRSSGVFLHLDPMRLLDPLHLSPTATPKPAR